MKINPKIIIGLAVLTVVLLGTYALSDIPYPGGGEIGSAFSSTTIDGKKFVISGQHNWPSDDRSDLDGDYEDYNDWSWVYNSTDAIDKPGITLESSNPYYLEETSDNTFRASDEAVASKTYEKNYTINGQQYAYRYNNIPYGVDITIKTDADRYYKDVYTWGVQGYGWKYESKPVDVNVLLNFGMNPWTPAGAWNNSYNIIGGWAGILQAEIYDIDYGVLQNDRLEQELDELKDSAYRETATTIQDLNSVNSALNMYIPGTDDSYQEIDFENQNALKSVRNAVNIEVGAKLAAGAVYTADIWGHTDSLAVRNVYVTYRIVVKVVATLNLKLVAEGSPIATAEEGNTKGDKPPIPIYSTFEEMMQELWADFMEWLRSPEVMFYLILIFVVIVIILYVAFKYKTRG